MPNSEVKELRLSTLISSCVRVECVCDVTFIDIAKLIKANGLGIIFQGDRVEV